MRRSGAWKKVALVVVGMFVLTGCIVLSGCKSAGKDETIKPEFEARTPDQPRTPRAPRIGEGELPPEQEMRNKVFGPSGLQTVHFDFDSSTLGPEARETLESNADLLKEASRLRALIEGHCCEIGTEEYNLALGQRRANVVRKYLIELGIDPNRLNTISYGELRPSDPRHFEDAYKKNRRGEFKEAL
jgi:peptidoglycan-associated lipoprotein